MPAPQYLIQKINDSGTQTLIPIKSFQCGSNAHLIATWRNITNPAALAGLVSFEVVSAKALTGLVEHHELLNHAKEECLEMLKHGNTVEYDGHLPQHQIILDSELGKVEKDQLLLLEGVSPNDVESQFQFLKSQEANKAVI